MKLIYVFSLLLSTQVYAQTNIKLIADSEIVVTADTTSTRVITDMDIEGPFYKLNSVCYLMHDSLPYDRKIAKGTKFFLKSNLVDHNLLSEKEIFEFLKPSIVALGGIWEGEGMSPDGPITIEAPKNLKELVERIKELNGFPATFPISSTVEIMIDDNSQRKLELSCHSDKFLSINEIINILVSEGDDFFLKLLKLDKSF